MGLQQLALIAGGAIGSAVAVVHGILTQRFMVKPLVQAGHERKMSGSIIRLIPVLLHFSTFIWFFGGLALIAAAIGLGPRIKLTIVLVGGSYLFGVIGNCWATRGRHPGWMLLALALVLTALGWK